MKSLHAIGLHRVFTSNLIRCQFQHRGVNVSLVRQRFSSSEEEDARNDGLTRLPGICPRLFFQASCLENGWLPAPEILSLFSACASITFSGWTPFEAGKSQPDYEERLQGSSIVTLSTYFRCTCSVKEERLVLDFFLEDRGQSDESWSVRIGESPSSFRRGVVLVRCHEGSHNSQPTKVGTISHLISPNHEILSTVFLLNGSKKLA